jgi:hypothetical protein
MAGDVRRWARSADRHERAPRRRDRELAGHSPEHGAGVRRSDRRAAVDPGRRRARGRTRRGGRRGGRRGRRRARARTGARVSA